VGVDLVVDHELLRLAPPDVRLRLVVGDQELEWPPVDPAALVDPVHRHLHADERRLAAGRRGARQGLERADLERLRLAERLAPGSRN
jgi:hypothetical protein